METQYHIFRLHWENGKMQTLVGKGDTQLLALAKALVHAGYDQACIPSLRLWEEITNGAVQNEDLIFSCYDLGRLSARHG